MDRFFRGLVAGISGGIVMNIWSFISFDILNFTQLRFIDWSAIFIFGDRPQSIIESLIALVTQIAWSGFLGIVLAYLMPLFTSRGYIIKAIYFGFITGFMMYAIPVMFNIQFLETTTTGTAASNMIGGILWGLTAAIVLKYLDTSPQLKS
ncbi:ABC-type polysaccharide/polyol phosphate export permease [Desulfitispora alkaliphila]|uniref:hypothetical protein n=1 Tax=Desulfitispora alkaliphila TaxID=622674 RepID=UPI003D21CC94